MGMIRVMLIDDQGLYRRGESSTLGALPDLEIVGEADFADDLDRRVTEAAPDLVILGELRGGWDVVAATLRRKFPHIGLVVLLSQVTEEDLFFALKAGAAACQPRSIRPEALAETVRRAHAGDCMISVTDATVDGPSRRLLAQLDVTAAAGADQDAPACPLSEREMEILVAVAEGCSNKEIGQRCGISDQTVKNHLTAVLRKLGVSDRTEAVVRALRYRWLKIESLKVGEAA